MGERVKVLCTNGRGGRPLARNALTERAKSMAERKNKGEKPDTNEPRELGQREDQRDWVRAVKGSLAGPNHPKNFSGVTAPIQKGEKMNRSEEKQEMGSIWRTMDCIKNEKRAQWLKGS